MKTITHHSQELHTERMNRAQEVGSIMAQVEILAIQVKCGSVTQKNIIRKLENISDRLDRLEL